MSLFTKFAKALAGLFGQPVKPSAPARWPAAPVRPVAAAAPKAPQPVAANRPPVDYTAYADGVLDAKEAYAMALWLRGMHPELAQADPFMAVVMAITESGGNTRNLKVNASRYEPAFFTRYIATQGLRDRNLATSFGIMQTMLNTAKEDYNRGFKAYGEPTATNLKNPLISLYFGMAHQVFIRQSLARRGLPATNQNVVVAYNGGVGTLAQGGNANTSNHWAKYQRNIAVAQSALA